jgi:hypothetical protein
MNLFRTIIEDSKVIGKREGRDAAPSEESVESALRAREEIGRKAREAQCIHHQQEELRQANGFDAPSSADAALRNTCL